MLSVCLELFLNALQILTHHSEVKDSKKKKRIPSISNNVKTLFLKARKGDKEGREKQERKPGN